MLKCPPELLVAITTHLPFSDKLTCSQVCREWNSTIKNTTLLSEVEFSCSKKYKIFTKRVKHKILLGSLVRKLVLNTDTLSWYDLRQIPILFPRLEEYIWPTSRYLLYMFRDLIYDDDDTDKEEKEEEEDDDPSNGFRAFQPWCHELKKLDMFALQGFIPELFDTVSLKNVTHLRLDFFGTTGPSYYYNHTIYALAEMPCLISLDLTTFDIDQKMFEQIHANAPNLVQLGLYHFQISIYDNDYENIMDVSTVDQAVHLKTLNLYNWCMLAGPNFFWLDYFVHKYPNLKCLAMDSELGGYNFFEDMDDNTHSVVDYKLFDIKILNILNKCPIKKLQILKQYMSPAILQKVEANEIELIGISITTQSELACALPTLRIMSSSHIYSVEKMLIYQLDSADWNYALPMGRMKKVDLTCQGESVSSLSLDLILSQCPNIEKICLKSTFITTSELPHDSQSTTTTTTILSHKLKKLTFKNVLIDNHLFLYISQCCPSLSSLFLEECKSTMNITDIHLPNHSLNKLSIRKQSGPYYCRVITEQTQGHYAIFGPPLALVTRDLDEDESSVEKLKESYQFDINFHCKALTHLFINNMRPY